MPPLPPLTEHIDRGAIGGLEFERLMHQLLLAHADRHGYSYQPRSGAGGDGGIDGLAPEGGLEGVRDQPVGVQFKWLWSDLHKGNSAQQIKKWLKNADRHDEIRHWILVTPWDLKPSEREWLEKLPPREDLRIHHWGQERVESLLRGVPALFARYYPQEAKHSDALGLADYDGFDFPDFAHRYRQQMTEVYQDVRTLGLPPETLREGDARRSIRLRDIFVPLKLIPEEDRTHPLSLADALRSHRSMVVLGDPGAGKSTLLTFLALLHAGAADLEGYKAATDTVPLLVPLRDFVRLQKEQRDLSFLGYLELRARTDLALEHAHRAFFESALRMGEAIVLLDGLDEVGNATRRRRIAGAIRAFRASYPDCPFWVTSRIYGYTGDVRLPHESFTETRVGRLDDDQIQEFIRRWYALHPNPRECEERAKSLRGAIERTPSVQRLATNPLLLTLMAFIHQGLRRLPQDRGELYEKCIEMLLKTWQEAKWDEGRAPPHPFEQVELFKYVNTQKDYLAHLAMFVQERRSATAEEGEERGLVNRGVALDCLVARHLEVARRTDPRLSGDRARTEMEQFLDYVSDRTGLLIDRGGDQLSFIHLSFQEYLAAWVFNCRSGDTDPRFFVRHLGDAAWEEVLLLRLYIILRIPSSGGTTNFDRIVRAMFRRLRWHELWQRLGFERFDTAPAWLTLARALRDQLDFQPADETRILRRALAYWIREPTFSGAWFDVFEEIRLLSSRPAKRLGTLLQKAVTQAAEPRQSAACLHLLARLFGLPSDTGDLLLQGVDWRRLLPDLVAHAEHPAIAPLLAKSNSVNAWHNVLSNLESTEILPITLVWVSSNPAKKSTKDRARGSIAILWDLSLRDLRSRSAFMERWFARRAADFSEARCAIAAAGELHSAELPLAGIRCNLRTGELPKIKTHHRATRLLCRRLVEKLFTEQARMPTTLLSAWAQSVAFASLKPFDLTANTRAAVLTLTQDFIQYFPHRFILFFSRYFTQAVARDFTRAFIKNSTQEFARDFAPNFTRTFTLRFASNFANSFTNNFTRDFTSIFGKIHSQESSSYNALSLLSTFHGDSLFNSHVQIAIRYGVDTSKNSDIERNWQEALVDTQAVKRLVSDVGFWSYLSFLTTTDVSTEPRDAAWIAPIANPLALPLVFGNLLNAAGTAYLVTAGRALASMFPQGNATGIAAETWMRQNPANVYAIAFAWEEHAKIYDSNHPRLDGPHGALMIAHAAYAALMTGIHCSGPVWTQLIEGRNRSDPLIEISYLFHEICHFRDSQANARKLKALIAERPEEAREVLDAAGIVA